MLVFGVDVPLLEMILVFVILVIIVLIEVIVVMFLTMKHMNKSKESHELVSDLAEVLLQVKQEEQKTIDAVRRLK